MPLRDHWWCILVAKYGAFLFTEIGAFVITDYTSFGCISKSLFCYLLNIYNLIYKTSNEFLIC